VVVRGVAAGATAERPEAVVDNAHCRFAPRVQVVTRGQSVRVRSSDPVLHNAHPVLVAEPEVSIANLALAVPGQTMDLTRRLAAALPASGEALVRLGCDVHPWMRGWLVVLDHPYAAVTGADGRFGIAAVRGAFAQAIATKLYAHKAIKPETHTTDFQGDSLGCITLTAWELRQFGYRGHAFFCEDAGTGEVLGAVLTRGGFVRCHISGD